MFRLVSRDATSSARLDVFALDGGWTEVPGDAHATVGVMQISPLAIEGAGARWRLELDAGWLSLAGPADCATVTCTRGFYRFALGRRLGDVTLDARAARAGFVAADDRVALEDRVTVGATGEHGRHQLATSGFLAYARPWTGGDGGATGGVEVAWSIDLGHGLWSIVRGERARSYYGTTDADRTPNIATSTRVTLGLGWSIGRRAGRRAGDDALAAR